MEGSSLTYFPVFVVLYLKLFGNIFDKIILFSGYFIEMKVMTSLFKSRDRNSYFFILLLAINDRLRFQMKKVINSKMAAVLVFIQVCWFCSFFTSEPLLSVSMATSLITVDSKLFPMIPYIIKVKVRKFHQPTANRFSTARKKGAG